MTRPTDATNGARFDSPEDLVGAHLLPERIERLVETFPRALFIGFRPEHADQPVAGHACSPEAASNASTPRRRGWEVVPLKR